MSTTTIISKNDLLVHWQGHRNLTRRTIEKFPEEQLFSFSIGGMRPFAMLVKEILAIAAPGVEEIVLGETQALEEERSEWNTKELLLSAWDESTKKIDALFGQIPDETFQTSYKAFGRFEGKVFENVFYFIDNEIHHRAQAFVYLRALGIEPPYFWER